MKSINLNKISIILHSRVENIYVGSGWEFFKNIVS